MSVGSFSHRRTCSIRLSWMGFRCSRVKGSPCSTSSTKRSLAGTFLGYGLFKNSEKKGFCRGCSGGSRGDRIQECANERRSTVGSELLYRRNQHGPEVHFSAS